MRYDSDFYSTLNDAGATSARAVLSIVLDLVAPTTAVDVGCGTGIWTAELVKLGVDAVGLDGEYVPADQLRIPSDRFLATNLNDPLYLGRTFDLAVCVEVAEHLPDTRSTGLVRDLCALAPAVLFSAATPKQGGTHHVNEQWLSYWMERFVEHGYTCWDIVRPAIRYDSSVAWIYRQNAVLALADGHPAAAGLSESARLRLPASGDVSFEYVARYIVEREEPAKLVLRRALGRRVDRVLRRRA